MKALQANPILHIRVYRSTINTLSLWNLKKTFKTIWLGIFQMDHAIIPFCDPLVNLELATFSQKLHLKNTRMFLVPVTGLLPTIATISFGAEFAPNVPLPS